MAAKRETVVAAVRRELAALARREPKIKGSVLAVIAVKLAEDIDSPDSSTSTRAAALRELREVFDRLAARAAGPVEASPLDEIRARRQRKIGRSAGSAPRVGAGRKRPSGR